MRMNTETWGGGRAGGMEKSWTLADTGRTDGMGKTASTKTKAPPESWSKVVRLEQGSGVGLFSKLEG